MCAMLIQPVRPLTLHASHVSTPGPVLSRCHGGDIVFWVCMHGLTHEGAIHVDWIVTAITIPVYHITHRSCIVIIIQMSGFRNMPYLVLWWKKGMYNLKEVKLKVDKMICVPFNWWVLILCESPVCVWLLQLQGKEENVFIFFSFVKKMKMPPYTAAVEQLW